ncbi:MAG: diaminopimelate epimerase [Deltaproteobacteria bacterium]|nr:diaminopimelate epimerase [Deltaproteobacteria bacterium]
MALLPFVKAEGLGNDFLVVDLRPGKPAHPLTELATSPETVRALCHRNFGVGGDGLLAILPGQQGDARMRVLNADGSEAEMCGNGIRCVCKILHDTDASMRRDVLRIDTGAGLRACRLDTVDGRVAAVTVDMGEPQLVPRLIPVASDAPRLVRAPFRAGEHAFAFTAVSMGNPHAVIFVDQPDANLRELATTYGPGIEHDPLFPHRTNVEFATVRQGADGAAEIDLVVWERGCGITLACGTGACATVVAACLEGRVAADHEIPLRLPGGTLFVTVRGGSASPHGPSYAGVAMRGPATIVFEAAVDPATIRLPTPRSS